MSSKCCDQDFDFTFYGLRLFCSSFDYSHADFPGEINSRYATYKAGIIITGPGTIPVNPSFAVSRDSGSSRQPPTYYAVAGNDNLPAGISEGDEFSFDWNDTQFGVTRRIYFSFDDSKIYTPSSSSTSEWTEDAENKISITRAEDFVGNRVITRRYYTSGGRLQRTVISELFSSASGVDYSFGKMSVKRYANKDNYFNPSQNIHCVQGNDRPSYEDLVWCFVYSFTGHVRFHSSGELAPRS